MTWQEIREKFARNWLLVEAIEAHDEGNQRIVNDLSVVGIYGEDFWSGWHRYLALHALDRHREYYVVHTDREALNIGIIDVFRFRPIK